MERRWAADRGGRGLRVGRMLLWVPAACLVPAQRQVVLLSVWARRDCRVGATSTWF